MPAVDNKARWGCMCPCMNSIQAFHKHLSNKSVRVTFPPSPPRRGGHRSDCTARGSHEEGTRGQCGDTQTQNKSCSEMWSRMTTNRTWRDSRCRLMLTNESRLLPPRALTCRFWFCPTKCRRWGSRPSPQWQWWGQFSQRSPLLPEGGQRRQGLDWWPYSLTYQGKAGRLHRERSSFEAVKVEVKRVATLTRCHTDTFPGKRGRDVISYNSAHILAAACSDTSKLHTPP